MGDKMGNLWYRKITKIGTGYAVFLPINWIRFNELRDDDKLKMTEKNNKIIIEITDKTYPNYDF